MLTPSELWQPVLYFQGTAVPGCLFQLLIQSLCNQQSGLSTIGRVQIPLGVRAIVAVAAWKGLPEQDGCCHMEVGSAPGS